MTGGRRAYSLIELLVVLAIIAALIACLLPALVAGRAASRRVGCVNNLKQLGLALQSYMMNQQVLPPGSSAWERPVSSTPGGHHIGWIVMILPHLEQAELFRAYDLRHGFDDPVNRTVGSVRISTLLCPAESAVSLAFPPGTFTPAAPASRETSSYAGVHHDVEAPIDVDNHGVLYLNSRVGPVAISDGLSQTIFVGEVRERSPLGWGSGTRATLRNTGHAINAQGGNPTSASAPSFVGGFGSIHQGDGANFAFGDGSVRFLKQTIDATAYQRLGHRCDGELIDDDAY